MIRLARRTAGVATAALVLSLAAGNALAGFAGKDVFLPSVGRKPGANNSQWYTMLWIHNPSSAPANVVIHFLLRDQPNPAPAAFTDTIPPGDSRSYPDTITTLFNTQAWGALRVTSDVEVVAECRMYNLPAGGQDKDTQGQDYSAIPAGFAIGAGQSTRLLGVSQTDPKADSQFRYSFGWVEAAGGTADVQVTAFDETGAQVATKTYPTTGAYEARYYPVEDLYPAVNSTDLTLKLAVVAGTGKVIAVGSGTANASNDSTTFEMLFADSLLGSGTGGLAAVSHDASLAGDGTSGSPLAIANGQVVRSLNGLHDAVTLAAGSNVTISPSGQTLTIAAGGAGGGLTLPFSGTASTDGTHAALAATNSGSGYGLWGANGNYIGVYGTGATGVYGASTGGIGVHGESGSDDGVYGHSATGYGVSGVSDSGSGVYGQDVSIGNDGCVGCSAAGIVGNSKTNNHSAIVGNNSGGSGGVGVYGLGDYAIDGLGTTYGVYGQGPTGVYGTGTTVGVSGNSTSGAGVIGVSSGNDGVNGTSTSGYGVHGQSASNEAVYGQNTSTLNDGCVGCPTAGVIGYSPSGGSSGVYGNNVGGGYGVFGNGGTGVYGYGVVGVEGSGTTYGVVGKGTTYGVYCVGPGAYIGSWSDVSDIRLKRDVTTLADALDKVMQLRGVNFYWRREEFPEKPFDPGPQIGFIAQEVEQVVPEVVSTGADGFKTLDYSKFTPLLTEAIKAQQAIIEAQRAELDRVNERLARLESELQQLVNGPAGVPQAAGR